MEHSSDKEKENTPRKPVYRILGESGLVVDEYGEIYDVTDVRGDEEPEQPFLGGPVSEDFKKSSFVSSLDDKANPAYWYHHYDERYCGCSREEYMEKMAEQYRGQKKQEKEVALPEEDKTDPAYWDFYYDARYCGPSREEYVERMVRSHSKISSG